MKHLSRRIPIVSTLLFSAALATQPRAALSQTASANAVLAQLAATFSNGKVVQQVQLSGSATWYAGSLEDSGPTTLTASIDGTSKMQIDLASTGQRVESSTGSGTNSECSWALSDGKSHAVDPGNCWRPSLWFLPTLSLQPSVLPNNLAILDLGDGVVGSSETNYRHLRAKLTFSGVGTELAGELAQRSTSDLGLDPVAFLPLVLDYSVFPDNGAQTPIQIEIRYLDYHSIDGVQIPFRIQRYLNGSLQLDIQVISAQVS